MIPEDRTQRFLYLEIFKGCKDYKVDDESAREMAQNGVDRFCKNQYVTVPGLISEMINMGRAFHGKA